MKLTLQGAGIAGLILFLVSCGGDSPDASTAEGQKTSESSSSAPKEGGSSQNGDNSSKNGGGHSHAEQSLGTAEIGSMKVELAQGHGKLAAGKEMHLVVKLPYSDKGSTSVRAWIGTENRVLSFVGKGTYSASHDDYDIHAAAPDPLSENAMWWVEIEKPDGTKAVGSAKPLR